jgi:hypothetical protein
MPSSVKKTDQMPLKQKRAKKITMESESLKLLHVLLLRRYAYPLLR